ncbi:Putative cytochrome P450 [Septoria linicola]|uniref:Cytochrome P450 n=1 Tax=Septoria linicola TaxID=215465 RepID=A0A9Q9EMK8_9PEZI|nr:Putative cytochrome P450 [Septoria linicola]
MDLSDRLAIKKIYGHGSKFVKSTFYIPFGQPDPTKANLFNDLDPHSHAQARRQVAALYSMSTMVSYEQFVDRCTDVLVSKFSMFAEKAQALDAFDVIGEITVGKSFGMMERGYDNIGILDAIDFSLVYGSFVGFLLPGIHRTFCAVTAFLGLRNPMQPLQDFIDDRIGERKVGKATTDRDDFLSKLLDMRAGGRIDEMALQNGVGSNIVAGSDTTAVSLSAVLYHLLQNPVCREKLQKEIADFQAEGTISDPVTFAEAQKMPYLQAVIKEALRMHPAVGLPLARIVPHGGAELAGYYFPAGTCVGVNAWVLHHDEEIFGTDADLFQPELWLRSKEEVSLMNENLFSFGAGSRTCIGKNISLLEMNKVLVQIYRRFNIEHVGKTQPKEWATNNRWFVKQKFECKIAPRT